MKKVVVIFSGGLDSTTLLHFLKNKKYKLYAISFDYNQRHLKELTCAKYWGEKLCEEHKIIKLDLDDVFSSSALINKDMNIPRESYSSENQEVTSVPFRNGIMLSIAVAYAEKLKIDEVYYAAHFNDSSIYPDTSEDFVSALSLASRLGTYNNIRIRAPFGEVTKKDIVNLGLLLDVDYSKTWSCYSEGERPCLVCPTCRERTEAFLLNDAKDPLFTSEGWGKAVEVIK